LADGHTSGVEDFDVIDAAALDEVIRKLEAGEPAPEFGIDLGGGCIARADGENGTAGLLQRLKGHRQLLRIAQSRTVLGTGGEPPIVDPFVQSLLDAVKKAG